MNQLDRIEAQVYAIARHIGAPVISVTPVDIVKPPVITIDKPPVVTLPSNIDYSPYLGMTPFAIMAPFGPFPSGLPVGWDWEAAYSAGVLRPASAPPSPIENNAGSNEYAPSGSEIPWNPPGQGRYLRCAGRTFVFSVKPPTGFTGYREIVIAQAASPYQTQYDRASVLFGGESVFSGGANVDVRIGPMVGGTTYLVTVSLDQDGAFTIQLV